MTEPRRVYQSTQHPRSVATKEGHRPSRTDRIGYEEPTERRDWSATDASDKLARVAIEIFLRTNACFARTETVDGKFSTAEGRAIRNCATLQDERLITTGTEPDTARAIEWLERTVSGN